MERSKSEVVAKIADLGEVRGRVKKPHEHLLSESVQKKSIFEAPVQGKEDTHVCLVRDSNTCPPFLVPYLDALLFGGSPCH